MDFIEQFIIFFWKAYVHDDIPNKDICVERMAYYDITHHCYDAYDNIAQN